MAQVTFITCDKCHDVIRGDYFKLIEPFKEWYFCQVCHDEFWKWLGVLDEEE